jgi:hypothetical protein
MKTRVVTIYYCITTWEKLNDHFKFVFREPRLLQKQPDWTLISSNYTSFHLTEIKMVQVHLFKYVKMNNWAITILLLTFTFLSSHVAINKTLYHCPSRLDGVDTYTSQRVSCNVQPIVYLLWRILSLFFSGSSLFIKQI